MEQNGYIVGQIAASTGTQIDADTPIPHNAPASIPQIKLERIRFAPVLIRQLLSKYGLSPSNGESWVMDIGSRINPDFELYYREENGLYGSIAYDETSPALPLNENDPVQCLASKRVQSFLDDLGLEYEYPFFRVVPLEKGLTEVVARLLVDGIPCNTTIGWTQASDGGGNGDPTPGAFFIVSKEGKLTTAVIRNPVSIIEKKNDSSPLMDWQTVLNRNQEEIVEFFHDEESKLVLHAVEFVMMVDAHQNAYPAWAYFFTRFMQADEFHTNPYSYDMALTYDARTGESVWHR
ncbi:MAG: hypothetical protein RSI32_00495 [Clostridia bacterium]